MRGSSSINRTSRLSTAVSFGLNNVSTSFGSVRFGDVEGQAPVTGPASWGKGFRTSGRYREVSFDAMNAGRRPGGGFGDVRLVQRVHLSAELNLAVGHRHRDTVGVEIGI